MNNSGIIPKGWRILILPDQVKNTTESGIILNTESQSVREQLAQMDGIVVEMGEDCFPPERAPNGPWCKVGDRVIFGKYSGWMRKGKDGKEYRLINDDNIVAVMETEDE